MIPLREVEGEEHFDKLSEEMKSTSTGSVKKTLRLYFVSLSEKIFDSLRSLSEKILHGFVL